MSNVKWAISPPFYCWGIIYSEKLSKYLAQDCRGLAGRQDSALDPIPRLFHFPSYPLSQMDSFFERNFLDSKKYSLLPNYFRILLALSSRELEEIEISKAPIYFVHR
jgi:hypothetical protein